MRTLLKKKIIIIKDAKKKYFANTLPYPNILPRSGATVQECRINLR